MKRAIFSAIQHCQWWGMVQKNPLADPFKVVMLDTEGKLCVVTVFNAKTVLINIKLL